MASHISKLQLKWSFQSHYNWSHYVNFWCFLCDFQTCIQIFHKLTKNHCFVLDKRLWIVFLCYSRLISMKKSVVPNTPFLILIFCPIWYHKWIFFHAKISKFSEKLPKTMVKSCKNFCGRGLAHFCATSIWNSVPRLMTHPVLSSKQKIHFSSFSNETLWKWVPQEVYFQRVSWG